MVSILKGFSSLLLLFIIVFAIITNLYIFELFSWEVSLHFIVGLLVPLAIKLGMQRWTPRLAAFMVRYLKGFSSRLLLFIIVFAIITNLYIFELFSWEVSLYFIVSLLVPLAIGLGMQRWTPRLAVFMVRILKGFSSLLLLFIIVFAIVTNLYIFELFSWEVSLYFIVGLLVPLAIGLGLQCWTPRLAAFMVRILKGFSSLLLLFIIVFAIITNLYIFELFSW